MKAITHERYGEDEVMQLTDVAVPEPADDEVRVAVHAAGLDQGVWHLMAGRPLVARAALGLRRPRNPVLGTDLAGVVDAVGASVTAFRPGDRVFGTGRGTFAEFAVTSASKLAAAPTSIELVDAAAVPVSGLTALQAVRDRADVRPGDRVLVIGASGGVGSFATQIAVAAGGEVTGVSHSSKTDLVRSLGATAQAYDVDGPTPGGPYEVIIDTGGHTSLAVLRRALTADGRLVIVGSETSGRWLGGLDRSMRASLLSPFTKQRLGTFVSSENGADLGVLAAMIDAGDVRPAVDRTYPLVDAADAMRRLRRGAVRGKVVVTV